MTRQALPMAKPGPGMSAAVKAGGSIYVSGQVATGPNGIVGEGDCEEQARQCFRNIDGILGQLGAGLADVVAVTTFLANASDSAAFLKVRSEVFANEPPATTTVVAALLSPALLVEVQVIAAVPGS